MILEKDMKVSIFHVKKVLYPAYYFSEVNTGGKKGQHSKVNQLLLKLFHCVLEQHQTRTANIWTPDLKKYCTLLPIYAVGFFFFFFKAKRVLTCFSWKDSLIHSFS